MREWLQKANGLNPQFRPICGFQPVFAADETTIDTVLEEVQDFDFFDILYTSEEVEIYAMCKLRRDGFIRFHDIRFIAQCVGHEAWLVVSGLIAVNRDKQLDPQIKRAKKALMKAISDQWGIDISLAKRPGA